MTKTNDPAFLAALAILTLFGLALTSISHSQASQRDAGYELSGRNAALEAAR